MDNARFLELLQAVLPFTKNVVQDVAAAAVPGQGPADPFPAAAPGGDNVWLVCQVSAWGVETEGPDVTLAAEGWRTAFVDSIVIGEATNIRITTFDATSLPTLQLTTAQVPQPDSEQGHLPWPVAVTANRDIVANVRYRCQDDGRVVCQFVGYLVPPPLVSAFYEAWAAGLLAGLQR